MKTIALFAMLVAASFCIAQGEQAGRPNTPKSQKSQFTAQGCVSRSSGYYILMQSGNSYVLEANSTINFARYLGKEVEIAGSERATLSTSSSRRDAPGLTIIVDSIRTISKLCTY